MKTIKNGAQFIDHDCKIGIQGITFTSDGAFILRNTKTNKLGGVLYAYPKENKVGNWNGSIKVRAYFAREWYSNIGDKRQSVYFTYEGIYFYGVYYKSNSDIVRIKQIERR
jgi:hypothetical protein